MLESVKSWVGSFVDIDNARKIRKTSRLTFYFFIFIIIALDIFFPISIPRHPVFWKKLVCHETGDYEICAYFINDIIRIFDIFQIFIFLSIGIILSAVGFIFLYMKDEETIRQLYIGANSKKIFFWRPVSQKQTLQRTSFLSLSIIPILWFSIMLFNSTNYAIMTAKDVAFLFLFIKSLSYFFVTACIPTFLVQIFCLLFFDIPPP